jgi:hypothetical protein
MSTYSLGGTPPGRDPQWARIRSALVKSNPQLRDATFTPGGPAGNRPRLKDPPLEGAAYGRLWEVAYYRPTTFSPDQMVNVVTAIKWGEPEQLILYETPWLYIGGRPRIFSRLSPDLDRILEKQRRADRSLAGYKTGDTAFDRQWAFYAYRSNPSIVLRDPDRRSWLQALADLRPRRRDEMPTIASLGTTVSLGVVVSDSDETVRQAGELIRSLSQLLDAIELSTGNLSASQIPLSMDLLPDGSGFPSPTLRLRCSQCGQECHPRFVPDYHTEICDQCRRGLYASW